MAEKIKGWHDALTPEELAQAVSNYRKQDLDIVDPYIVLGKISTYEQSGLLSPEIAEELKLHIQEVMAEK